MNLRSLCFLILLCCHSLGTETSAREILWMQHTAQARLDQSPFHIWAEAQFRRLDWLAQPQATLLRTAALYDYSMLLQFGLGIGAIPQFLPFPRQEFRVFQQALFRPENFWQLEPRVRLRLEQRSLEGIDGLAWRVRSKQQLSYMPSTLGAFVWTEIFYHLNSPTTSIATGFDQLRTAVGPRYKSGAVTAELGYLVQTLRSGQMLTWNHGLSTALMIQLD